MLREWLRRFGCRGATELRCVTDAGNGSSAAVDPSVSRLRDSEPGAEEVAATGSGLAQPAPNSGITRRCAQSGPRGDARRRSRCRWSGPCTASPGWASDGAMLSWNRRHSGNTPDKSGHHSSHHTVWSWHAPEAGGSARGVSVVRVWIKGVGQNARCLPLVVEVSKPLDPYCEPAQRESGRCRGH